MKKISLLLAVVFVFGMCRGQDSKLPVNSEGRVEYMEVVNVDSMGADKLFSNAKLFITDVFRSGKAVTQLTDDVGKAIVGKGTMKVVVVKAMGMTWDGYVWFTVSISCKDNRYKYSFSSFNLDYQGGTKMPHITDASLDDTGPPRTVSKKQWAAVKQQVGHIVELMINDLKIRMKNNEEW